MKKLNVIIEEYEQELVSGILYFLNTEDHILFSIEIIFDNSRIEFILFNFETKMKERMLLSNHSLIPSIWNPEDETERKVYEKYYDLYILCLNILSNNS